MAAAALCLAAWAGAATAADYQYRYVSADQAAADGSILARTDFGPPKTHDWATHPGLSPVAHLTDVFECARKRPHLSDLVTTGRSTSAFWSPSQGTVVYSALHVFKTAGMLERAWKREFEPDLACSRATAKAQLTEGRKLVAMKRLSYPRVGSRTAAFRVRIRQGNGDLLQFDVAAFAYRAKRSIGLIVTQMWVVEPRGPWAMRRIEQHFQRVMLSRLTEPG